MPTHQPDWLRKAVILSQAFVTTTVIFVRAFVMWGLWLMSYAAFRQISELGGGLLRESGAELGSYQIGDFILHECCWTWMTAFYGEL
jgi:hypothetical protein